MKIVRRWIAIASTCIAAYAGAQDGPIRILVGFPPGGGSDLVARLVAEHMRTTLNTVVVVENRPGVNGVIAAEALKAAAPDGRTLMVSPIAVTVFAPLTSAKLGYDPALDFAPVSLAAEYDLAIAVGAAAGPRSLSEYVRWAGADRANAAYGVPTAGGPPHFFGAMLARATGIDMVAVPYKGGPPLLNDLVGGQVPAAITSLADLLPQHQAGKVRILATTGTRRSTIAPDVPTFAELGFGNLEGSGWQAFHTRAGTPRPVIERLAAAIAAALRSTEVKARLVALGLEPVGSTPDELAARIAQDTARWAPIVKAAGFHAGQ